MSSSPFTFQGNPQQEKGKYKRGKTLLIRNANEHQPHFLNKEIPRKKKKQRKYFVDYEVWMSTSQFSNQENPQKVKENTKRGNILLIRKYQWPPAPSSYQGNPKKVKENTKRGNILLISKCWWALAPFSYDKVSANTASSEPQCYEKYHRRWR